MNSIDQDKTWSGSNELFPGIWVYRNVFKENLNIPQRLDEIAASAETEKANGYKWTFGSVGYLTKKPEYRDCYDIKIGEIKNPLNNTQKLAGELWQDLRDAQISAVSDYCTKYSIRMNYWEVMNCIRYTEGQHFQEHADDGFSYSATVSLVGYPNDDYTGGGLKFPKLGIEIKPQAGDLYIFPSTFLFSHIALPVESGTKYSVVTMLDYSSKFHNPKFYQEKSD